MIPKFLLLVLLFGSCALLYGGSPELKRQSCPDPDRPEAVSEEASNGNTAFPSLNVLEQMLPEALDLMTLKLELKKQKLQHSLWNQFNLNANYSQRISSPLPFIPTPEFATSGASFVGVHFSVKLARLLRRPTPEDVDEHVKTLTYEKIYQDKLGRLRLLYRNREKLLSRLSYLTAQSRTAGLHLQKIKAGLRLTELFARAQTASDGIEAAAPAFTFDAIDLAEAEEKVVKIQSEQSETLLEIANLETEIWTLLGKTQVERTEVPP